MRANHRIFLQKKNDGGRNAFHPPPRSYDRVDQFVFSTDVDQFVFYAPQKNRTTTWAARMRRNIDNG